MGWERRGNNRYYYRKRWVNGQAEGEYIGSGHAAEVLAELDARDRQERQRAASEWQAVVKVDRRSVAAMVELDEMVRSAVAAVLIVNGYHHHKRQWRKRR